MLRVCAILEETPAVTNPSPPFLSHGKQTNKKESVHGVVGKGIADWNSFYKYTWGNEYSTRTHPTLWIPKAIIIRRPQMRTHICVHIERKEERQCVYIYIYERERRGERKRLCTQFVPAERLSISQLLCLQLWRRSAWWSLWRLANSTAEHFFQRWFA